MHQQLRRGGLSSIVTWFYFTPTCTSFLHQPALPLYLPWKFCKFCCACFHLQSVNIGNFGISNNRKQAMFCSKFLNFWSIAKNYETNFLKKLCFEKFDGKILFISCFQKKNNSIILEKVRAVHFLYGCFVYLIHIY